MSKRGKILQHFKSGHSLTKIQSIIKFGYINLGGYVHVLRGKGYLIDTNMIHNHYGADYAAYKLVRG